LASVADRRGRLASLRARPRLRPRAILIALLGVGLALRGLAALAWWPVGLGLNDSAPYATAAATSPLSDVQHPAGYPAFLAAVGWVTRQVAAVALLQHLLGMLAAVVIFAAVRRVTGSDWLGLLPAGAVLLGGDQIYLEHNVMAEGLAALPFAATFYAGVRLLEAPRSLAWGCVTGLLVAVDVLIREAAVGFAPIVLLAVLLAGGPRRPRLATALVTVGVTVIVLGAYAGVNLAVNGELAVGPKPGWHLYGMVAPYASCAAFSPPPGTRVLCTSTPPAARPRLAFYLYDPSSPAQRAFGYFGHDGEVGAFAEQVVLHQPWAYLHNVAANLAAYFVPSSYPRSVGGCALYPACGLSPELDWTRDDRAEAQLARVMQRFYAPFVSVSRPALRRFLGAWQRVFRFGALLLVVTTVLTGLALLLAPDRRAVLVLFGGGGLSLLVPPSVIGEYVGRYSVPAAMPMLACAAVAGQQIWRYWSLRRRRPGRLASAGGAEPGHLDIVTGG
jgi:hypothetical protein